MRKEKIKKEVEENRETLSPEILDELVKMAKGPFGLFGKGGAMETLKKALMQRLLETEMTAHLGYPPNAVTDSENARNGYSEKTVHTESGPTRIQIPRDRAGTFGPQLVPKHVRHLQGFDEKVLSLYSRGMSTREIQGHLSEIYGADVSPDLISTVTDAVIDEMKTWQERPVDAVYPVIYLDALFVNIRSSGLVTKKAVYLALGVNLAGEKEVLGLWMAETEGAKFWLGVLTDLANRGLKDVFIIACDGLTGFPDAIRTAFPKAIVQTCIVHMIRASLKYVSFKDRRAVVASIKNIYTADTLRAAEMALDEFEKTWGKLLPTVVKMWRNRWEEVIPFLAFPKDVRRMLYTTNAIESVNAQLRKVLRAKGSFPNEESAFKLLFLALKNAKVKWKPSRDWNRAMLHFQVLFADRFPLNA